MYLHPIKTEADYDNALARINELFSAQPDTPDGGQLEVLTTLVEAYERTHHPVLPPDPVEALLYYLESRGVTRRDLEPYIGSRARVAEVLNRRRALTMAMVRRLHAGLGISAAALIQAIRCPGKSRARQDRYTGRGPESRLRPLLQANIVSATSITSCRNTRSSSLSSPRREPS